jgi:hypothetical protein
MREAPRRGTAEAQNPHHVNSGRAGIIVLASMPLAGTVESALTWGWTDPLTVAAAMFTAAFLWRGAFTNVQTTRTHLIVRNALWTHRVLWSDVREIGFPDDEPGAKLTVRRMHGRDIRASVSAPPQRRVRTRRRIPS